MTISLFVNFKIISAGANHAVWIDDPIEFCCLISDCLMEEPVVTPSGHSFDRLSIEKWISMHGTCPVTREKLSKNDLTLNRNLQDAINRYKKERAIESDRRYAANLYQADIDEMLYELAQWRSLDGGVSLASSVRANACSGLSQKLFRIVCRQMVRLHQLEKEVEELAASGKKKDEYLERLQEYKVLADRAFDKMDHNLSQIATIARVIDLRAELKQIVGISLEAVEALVASVAGPLVTVIAVPKTLVEIAELASLRDQAQKIMGLVDVRMPDGDFDLYKIYKGKNPFHYLNKDRMLQRIKTLFEDGMTFAEVLRFFKV